MEILGTRVDFLTKDQVRSKIKERLEKEQSKPLFIVTANAEFVLHAKKNPQFAGYLNKSDLILPDGVSLLEAKDFLGTKSKKPLPLFLKGIFIGFKTLVGIYNNKKITGIDLFSEILSYHDKKIFLLGGYHGVAKILAQKYNCSFDEGSSDITRISKEENQKIISRIKEVNPDFLFVSFGHFKQEIWIAKNLGLLSCKVVMGVGSSFDELAQIGIWKRKTPEIFKRTGLKWLWRLTKNPSHFGRVWNAVFIFPLKIYFSKIKF